MYLTRLYKTNVWDTPSFSIFKHACFWHTEALYFLKFRHEYFYPGFHFIAYKNFMGYQLHFDLFLFKHDKPCFMYFKKLRVRKIQCRFGSMCNKSRQNKCIKSAVVGSMQYMSMLSVKFVKFVYTIYRNDVVTFLTIYMSKKHLARGCLFY